MTTAAAAVPGWSDAEVCRIGLQLRPRGEHGRALSERVARVDGDEKSEGDASSLIIVISLPHVLRSPTAATALDKVLSADSQGQKSSKTESETLSNETNKCHCVQCHR